MAKAALWLVTDAEARKRGEQTGLDTLVVHALLLVAIIQLGTLARLPVINRRKVGMTSNHHAPYDLGYTRATMAGTTSRKPVTAS